LEAGKITVKETVSASKKLAESDARKILGAASVLYVAKGKKLSEFDLSTSTSKDAVAAMLGPTGNLRAPTLCVGKKVIVGYNEDLYRKVLA